MRAFYKQSLWILQNFLLTNPDLHHGLLGHLAVRSLCALRLGWCARDPWQFLRVLGQSERH